MSDKNKNDSLFSNQDTIVRRAWINTALESARSRLESGLEADVVAGNIEGPSIDGDEGGSDAQVSGQPAAAGDGSTQPNLYVAWSSRERRSGT